jgi:hypothetical protein
MQKQTYLIKLKEKRKYNPFLANREETLLCTQAPCLFLETLSLEEERTKIDLSHFSTNASPGRRKG